MLFPYLRRLMKRLPDSNRQDRRGRISRGLAGSRPCLEPLEDRTLPSVEWVNPEGGDWQIPSNWSGGQLPGPSDDVLIDVPGNITVSFASGTASIRSLQCRKNLVISGGNFTVSVTSAINNTFTQSGGTFDGGSDLTVTGLMTWSGGRMTGSGRTRAVGGILLNGSDRSGGSQVLDARILDNAGTTTWTGAGSIGGANGSVFNNLAGATFEIQNDAGFAPSTFNNAGRLRKTITVGTTTFAASLANTGTMEITSGMVVLGGGGIHTGTFTVAAGATLDFSGGAHTLLANSSLTGAGTMAFDGGQSTTVAGTYTITGNTTLNSGSVTFAGTATTATANFNGGTLAGSGTVTVTGASSWMGTTMTGQGRTAVNGGLSITGNTSRTLDGGRIFDNGATATWTGTGGTVVMNGAVFNNLTGATFLVQSDSSLSAGSGMAGAFNNLGTFRKSASSGTSTSSVLFTNNGAVDVQTGTLNFFGSGNHNGTFTVASGATLAFGGRQNLNSSSAVRGAGIVFFGVDGSGTGITTISGSYTVTGTTRITTGTVNFVSDVTLTTLVQLGGVLGGGGTVTVGGTLTWSGGTMSGPGRTVAGGGMNITGNTAKALRERTLNNSQTAIWNGTASISFSEGAIFNNAAGALFNAQNDVALDFGGGDPVTFNNAGLFRKSLSGGTSTLSIPLQNTGTVDVQTGTLLLSGGGVGDGMFTVATGSTLQFAGAAYLLGSSSQVTGTGGVTFGIDEPTGGNTTVAGTYSVAATNVNAGTVNFVSNSATGTATLSRGVLTGLGTFTVSGLLTWTGGTMSDLGRTVAAGGLAISGSNSKFLDARTLDNTGTGTWTGTGDIRASRGAVLNNLTGAVFQAQNDANFTSESGAPAVFNNGGTFGKSASTATTALAVQFNNTGTVNVQTGTLELANGGTSSGSFSIAEGALLTLSRGSFTLTGGASADNGFVTVTGATLGVENTVSMQNLALASGRMEGTGRLSVTGTLNWTGGTMGGTGATDIASAAVLNITGPAPKALSGRTLNNAGTGTWTGSSDITLGDGAVLGNLSGAVFDVQNDQAFSNGAPPATIINAGIFRKSAGAGSTTLTTGVSLTNAGTIEVRSGTISVAHAFTNAGTLDIRANSTFTAEGDYTQATGAVTGAGDLLVNGLLTWNGGIMKGIGQTTANGGLALDGTNLPTLEARTFNNVGYAVWTGRNFVYATLDSVFNNLPGATLDAQGDTVFLGNGDTTPVFNNQGTFLKSAGTGVTRFDGGVVFNNAGTVDVDTGTASFKTGGTHSGSFLALEGSTLAFLARTVHARTDEHNFLPSSRISSAGTVLFESGPSHIGGTYTADTTIVETAGTVDFANDDNLNVLTIHRGTVTGAGTLAIAGLFTWNGGAMTGTGATTATGGMVILGEVLLSRPALINVGLAVWMGPGNMTLAEGAVFNNTKGSTCDLQGDRTFTGGSGAAALFNNAGTFLKSQGTATTISVSFSNTGSLAVQTGTLQFAGSFTNDGSAIVQAGTLFISGPFANFSGATLTGGTFVVRGILKFTNADIQTNAATLVLDGLAAQILNQQDEDALANFATNDAAGSLTLTNGASLTTAGDLSNQGSLTLGPGSVLAVTGDYSQSSWAALEVQIGGCPDSGGFGQLIAAGRAMLAGTLNVSLVNGFRPQAGDRFQVLTFGTRAGDFDAMTGLDLGGGLHFNPVYDDASLTLVTETAICDWPEMP